MNRLTRFQTILFATALVIFLFLWALVASHNPTLDGLDRAVRHFLNARRNPAMNAFFTTITRAFNFWPMVTWSVLIVGLCWLRGRRHFCYQYLVTMVVGTGLNKLIKHLVLRPRPGYDRLMHYGGYSFPSGHSSGVVLVLGSLIVLTWESHLSHRAKWAWTILLTAGCLLIGFSRVYVGAHYASDVLAGWCLGVLVVLVNTALFTGRDRLAA